MDLYQKAHLVTAAVRVLEHRDQNPPSVEKVCQTLSFSAEHGNMIIRKLADMGILEVAEGPYGSRMFVRNHLAIEEIDREKPEESLAGELAKFQNARKEHSRKIESIKAEQEAKRKNLFAEIEKKLKADLEKKKNGP